MQADLTLGVSIGLFMATLAWVGNVVGSDSGQVSAFPDLLTLALLPLLLVLGLRKVVRDGERPSRSIFRASGLRMVGAGAVVFALVLAALGVLRFSAPFTSLTLITFAMALGAYGVVGSVTVWMCSAWFARRTRGEAP